MAYEDNSNPFSLNDFPDELLLGMMIKMNDTSLLNMTRACKRFRAIAKEAFGKKYNTDAYEVKILCDSVIDDEKRYRPFFCTFGENIQAIEITFDAYHPVPEDHWIYDSMQRYCSSLKRLDVASGEGVDLTKILLQQPTLTHLSMYLVEYRDTHWTKHSFPNLQSFQLNDVSGPYNQRRNLEEFFHNNRQLTKLSIENDGNVDAVNIMDSLNGKLPNLRSLDVCFSNFRRYFRPPNKNLVSTVITMEKLEFLSLMGKSRSILGPISKGCKNIQKLKLWSQLEDGEWNDTVSAICSLDKLTKLKINAHNIGVSHLQRIVDRLPNLTRLHLTDISSKSDAFKSLPIIVASSMKLIKLKANDRNEVNWSHEFIKSMAKLTQLINGLKVQITSGRDQLIITRGEVRRCNSIIYCVGNVCINDASTLNLLDLSDPYLEKIISLLDADSLCVLYNSCTRMQKLVKDYISSHVFHVTTIIKENVLHTLGNHISHISVKNVGPDGSVLWPNINRHCPSITELVTTGYRLTITDTLVWPNVKKLIISVYANINYHSVRLFVCPMLEHLEIRFLNADGVQADKFDHEDQYCHLTALKVREIIQNKLDR